MRSILFCDWEFYTYIISSLLGAAKAKNFNVFFPEVVNKKMDVVVTLSVKHCGAFCELKWIFLELTVIAR